MPLSNSDLSNLGNALNAFGQTLNKVSSGMGSAWAASNSWMHSVWYSRMDKELYRQVLIAQLVKMHLQHGSEVVRVDRLLEDAFRKAEDDGMFPTQEGARELSWEILGEMMNEGSVTLIKGVRGGGIRLDPGVYLL